MERQEEKPAFNWGFAIPWAVILILYGLGVYAVFSNL